MANTLDDAPKNEFLDNFITTAKSKIPEDLGFSIEWLYTDIHVLMNSAIIGLVLLIISMLILKITRPLLKEKTQKIFKGLLNVHMALIIGLILSAVTIFGAKLYDAHGICKKIKKAIPENNILLNRESLKLTLITPRENKEPLKDVIDINNVQSDIIYILMEPPPEEITK